MADGVQTQIYQSPPITEAVIGVVFESPARDSDLGALQKKLAPHYPHYQPITNFNLALHVDDGPQGHEAKTDLSEATHHRRSSHDQTEIVLLQPQLAIFSQLAPYPGWDYFYSRFVRDWKVLKRASGFRPIKQIGVRYINRIDIPVNGDADLVIYEDYLNIYPNMPSELGPLIAYAIQAEVEIADIKSVLKINSAAVPSPVPGYASFVVDIDVVRLQDVPQKDGSIFELIQQIRFRKNVVFESLVSDRARGLFRYAK